MVLFWTGWGVIYHRIHYQPRLVATALHFSIVSYGFTTILNERNVFQLFIVDGEKLKNQPAAVMHNVQRFLHIEPHYEYNDLLR